jgi:hypothetical protein
MPLMLAPRSIAPALLHSFISGIGERAAPEDLAGLRIGLPLRLRRAARPSRGCALEILAPSGRPLGWLPREDAAVLEALDCVPDAAAVRVSGIVPAFQRPRVQIVIELPAWPEEVAPAA